MCPPSFKTEQTPLVAGAAYGSIEKSTPSENDEAGEAGHGKTIGYLGAFAIGVNSLCGPALLQLPFQYQQSGLIPTNVCLVLVGILSSFVTLHMSNVVSKVPGNAQFEKTCEFSDPFGTFWSRKAFLATQVMFYLCTISLNIAAIVDTAGVVDSFLDHTVGSYAFAPDQLFDQPVQEWHHGPCTRTQVKKSVCEPFQGIDTHNDGHEYSNSLITLGYVIAATVFLPVCLMDLKENTNWQIFGLLVTLTVSLQFIVSFLKHGIENHRVSMWGHDYSGMLGVILFNYSLVLAMPAVLAEKKPHVKTNSIVLVSVVLTTLLYVLVGALGGMCMSHVNINMLKPMVSGAYGETLQWSGWFFAFFIIGLDIPLFCVLTRYNLTSSGLCSKRTANILVVYLPWGLSWIFYQGDAIAELLSWGGILFTSAVAFLLPLYLALRALLAYLEAEGSIEVYGGHLKSYQGQTIALYVLLFLATAAVCLGIVGQVESDIKARRLVNNTLYLTNGESGNLTL